MRESDSGRLASAISEIVSMGRAHPTKGSCRIRVSRSSATHSDLLPQRRALPAQNNLGIASGDSAVRQHSVASTDIHRVGGVKQSTLMAMKCRKAQHPVTKFGLELLGNLFESYPSVELLP